VSWFYRNCARPWLFGYDSEEVHNQTLDALAWASRRPIVLDVLRTFYAAQPLPVKLWGLTFPNPVGLAAGMDKHGKAVPVWEALGFGFCELGGVTAHAQPGNPTPRMFRIVEDEALINRMGFNNPGAKELARTLREWKESGLWPSHPVGINLGKSKITPLEGSADDYGQSLKELWEYGDFFVVNVSSPNTPNLRELQDKEALNEILKHVQGLNTELATAARTKRKPLLVKVAPDLSFEALDEIVEVLLQSELSGIVATNTTIDRPSTASTNAIYSETGGLSGKPLATKSTQIIRHLSKVTGGRLPIIGVGGIFSANDAWEKLEAGASLIQVYTGLVYEGPGITRAILKGLMEKLGEKAITDLGQIRYGQRW
jgi:dihydroorotate dehydrogenase